MFCFSLQLVKDLLTSLPAMFSQTRETHSALGPALQAAFKLMSPTGGRVSVFQTQLPTLGAGKLQSREDPNQRSSTKVCDGSLTCHFIRYGLRDDIAVESRALGVILNVVPNEVANECMND